VRATPAADPMASMLPPVPAVRVTRSHWPWDMFGSMVRTANITGMLSTIADSTPTRQLAQVAPRSVYMNLDTSDR